MVGSDLRPWRESQKVHMLTCPVRKRQKKKRFNPDVALAAHFIRCPSMAACAHQWSRGALIVPHRASRCAATLGARRDASRTLPRAVYQDVETLWSEVRFPSPRHERTSFEKSKEACWLAAYDAPFHGVPGGPYMHGRFATMNDHIAKMHGRFLESSRRALCGHELSAGEFADAVDRVAATLNVEMSEAVRVVFGEPSLVAASEADIVRRLVELRGTHENEDIARLVVASEGALLADAAHVECEPS